MADSFVPDVKAGDSFTPDTQQDSFVSEVKADSFTPDTPTPAITRPSVPPQKLGVMGQLKLGARAVGTGLQSAFVDELGRAIGGIIEGKDVPLRDTTGVQRFIARQAQESEEKNLTPEEEETKVLGVKAGTLQSGLKNLGYSAANMIPQFVASIPGRIAGAEAGAALGALGGPAAPITVPTAAAIGGIVGGSVTGGAAGYQTAKRADMNMVLRQKRDQLLQINPDMTEQEWSSVKQAVDSEVEKHSTAEGKWEAFGNAVQLGVMSLVGKWGKIIPLRPSLAKPLAVVGGAAIDAPIEIGSEAMTQIDQSVAERAMGLREQGDPLTFKQAVGEVGPQTLVTQLATMGIGGALSQINRGKQSTPPPPPHTPPQTTPTPPSVEPIIQRGEQVAESVESTEERLEQAQAPAERLDKDFDADTLAWNDGEPVYPAAVTQPDVVKSEPVPKPTPIIQRRVKSSIPQDMSYEEMRAAQAKSSEALPLERVSASQNSKLGIPDTSAWNPNSIDNLKQVAGIISRPSLIHPNGIPMREAENMAAKMKPAERMRLLLSQDAPISPRPDAVPVPPQAVSPTDSPARGAEPTLPPAPEPAKQADEPGTPGGAISSPPKPAATQPKSATTAEATAGEPVKDEIVPLYHVGVALKSGEKIKPDFRGLVWFSSSPSAYGANMADVPVTKINIPSSKLLMIEDLNGKSSHPDAEEFFKRQKTGSKEESLQIAEGMGYEAVQRVRDISMRPEIAEKYLSATPPADQSVGVTDTTKTPELTIEDLWDSMSSQKRSIVTSRSHIGQRSDASKKWSEVPLDRKKQYAQDIKAYDLPEGYTREGDRYVFKGGKTAQPGGKTAQPRATALAKVAEGLGIRYDGVQEGSPEPLQFTDPKSGATFYMPENATAAQIGKRLAEKREAFKNTPPIDFKAPVQTSKTTQAAPEPELIALAKRPPKNTSHWPESTKPDHEVMFMPYGKQGAGFYQSPAKFPTPVPKLSKTPENKAISTPPPVPTTPAAEPVTPEVKETREPWQMTKTEFRSDSVSEGRTGKLASRVTEKDADRMHRTYIEEALAAGKPVPESVLADYPELKSARIPTTPAEKREALKQTVKARRAAAATDLFPDAKSNAPELTKLRGELEKAVAAAEEADKQFDKDVKDAKLLSSEWDAANEKLDVANAKVEDLTEQIAKLEKAEVDKTKAGVVVPENAINKLDDFNVYEWLDGKQFDGVPARVDNYRSGHLSWGKDVDRGLSIQRSRGRKQNDANIKNFNDAVLPEIIDRLSPEQLFEIAKVTGSELAFRRSGYRLWRQGDKQSWIPNGDAKEKQAMEMGATVVPNAKLGDKAPAASPPTPAERRAELQKTVKARKDAFAGEKLRLVNRESGSGDQTPPPTPKRTVEKVDTKPASSDAKGVDRPLLASVPKEWPDKFREALRKESELRGWNADSIQESFPNGLDRVADQKRFSSIFGDAARKAGYRKNDSRFMSDDDFAQQMLGAWNVPAMMKKIDGIIRKKTEAKPASSDAPQSSAAVGTTFEKGKVGKPGYGKFRITAPDPQGDPEYFMAQKLVDGKPVGEPQLMNVGDIGQRINEAKWNYGGQGDVSIQNDAGRESKAGQEVSVQGGRASRVNNFDAGQARRRLDEIRDIADQGGYGVGSVAVGRFVRNELDIETATGDIGQAVAESFRQEGYEVIFVKDSDQSAANRAVAIPNSKTVILNGVGNVQHEMFHVKLRNGDAEARSLYDMVRSKAPREAVAEYRNAEAQNMGIPAEFVSLHDMIEEIAADQYMANKTGKPVSVNGFTLMPMGDIGQKVKEKYLPVDTQEQENNNAKVREIREEFSQRQNLGVRQDSVKEWGSVPSRNRRRRDIKRRVRKADKESTWSGRTSVHEEYGKTELGKRAIRRASLYGCTVTFVRNLRKKILGCISNESVNGVPSSVIYINTDNALTEKLIDSVIDHEAGHLESNRGNKHVAIISNYVSESSPEFKKVRQFYLDRTGVGLDNQSVKEEIATTLIGGKDYFIAKDGSSINLWNAVSNPSRVIEEIGNYYQSIGEAQLDNPQWKPYIEQALRQEKSQGDAINDESADIRFMTQDYNDEMASESVLKAADRVSRIARNMQKRIVSDKVVEDEPTGHQVAYAELVDQLRDAVQSLHAKAVAEGGRNVMEQAKAVYKVTKMALPSSVRGKMMSSILQVKDEATAAKALSRLQDIVDDWQTATLTANIKKTAQKVFGGAKIHIDQKKAARELMASVNIGELNPAELFALNQQMNGILLRGRFKFAVQDAFYADQRKQDLRRLKAAQTNPWNLKEIKVLGPNAESLTMTDKVQNAIKNAANIVTKTYNYSMGPMRQFMMLDNWKELGEHFKTFMAPFLLRENAFQKTVRPVLEGIKKIVEKHKLTQEDVRAGGIYAAAKQEGGMEKLANLEWEPEAVKAVVARAEKNEGVMELYNYVRKSFDELRPELRRVLAETYNLDMKEVDAYIPFMTDYALSDDIEASTPWDDITLNQATGKYGVDTVALRQNIQKQWSKARTGAGKQKINVDLLYVATKRLQDMHYFIHMAAETKRLGELANTDAYRNIAGDEGQRFVRNYIDTVARRGGTTSVHNIRALDKVINNLGVGVLGLRFSTILIQPTSMFNAMGIIGHRAVTGVADMLNPTYRNFVIDNMPEITSGAGGDMWLRESRDSLQLGKWRKRAMNPIIWTDLMTRAGVAWGAYQKYMSDNNLEIDLSKPNQEAIQYAHNIASQTQGSGSFMRAALLMSRGMIGNSKTLTRALTQFQSYPMNTFHLMVTDGIMSGIKNKDYVKLARITMGVQAAFLAEGLVRAGLVSVLGGSDAEDKKDLEEFLKDNQIKNQYSGIPLIGSWFTAAQYDSMPMPVAETLRKVVKGFRSSIEAKTPAAQARGAVKATGAAAALAGIPGVSQATQIAGRHIKSDKEETTVFIRQSVQALPKNLRPDAVVRKAMQAYQQGHKTDDVPKTEKYPDFLKKYKAAYTRLSKKVDED